MIFTIDKQAQYTVVKVNAEMLDSTISPGLKSELVILSGEGAKNIILDLSSTRYCDSSGLSAILVANRLCKNVNGILVLIGIQEAVNKLIAISQLDSILTITPTLEDAVKRI